MQNSLHTFWRSMNRMARVLPVCVCFLLTGAAANAQALLKKEATISFKPQTLTLALTQLQKETGVPFVFNPEQANQHKVAAVTFRQKSLQDILRGILPDVLAFEETNNYILIKPAVRKAPAQKPGTLRGRVVDFETAQPLPGATVQLDGTAIGVTTDEKGYYELKNIPEGTYQLVTSYIGFQRNVLPDVKVVSEKSGQYDIKMQAGGSLKEVVVNSGIRNIRAVTHTTDRQLLEEIRTARAVVSGISSEQISRSADRNAGEIVKRITGVTVVDDKFIVVRGMNQRYNITYLNDNIAPATELYSRTFAYDLLPSPIIDRIMVYKSSSADLLGDYTGGAVKVYTKNAKPVKHLDIGIQLGFRPGSNSGTKINSYQGGKTDWLGFDDGTRKLSANLPDYLGSGGTNTLSQKELLQSFTPNLQYGTKTSMPDLQLFGNYYNAWKLGNGYLYNLTSLTFGKETTRLNIYRQSGNTYSFAGSGNFLEDRNQIAQDDQSTEKVKINLLQNFTLKLNNRHQIVFNNFLLNEGSSSTSINTAAKNISPAAQANYSYEQNRRITLSYLQRFLYSGNLGGTHQLGKDNRHTFNWNLGYSYSRQYMPDQRVLNFKSFYTPSEYDWRSAELPEDRWVSNITTGYRDWFFGKIARIFTTNEESIYNGSVDHTWQISPAFSLKAGTYHLFRTREVNRRFFRVDQAGMSILQPPGNFDPQGSDVGFGYLDYNRMHFRQSQLSHVWQEGFFPEDGSGLKIYDVTTPADSYVATEQLNSGYLMGDWKAANGKLIANFGARIEYDEQKVIGAYQGRGDISGVILPVPVDNRQTKILPSLNVSYQPDSTLVIRAGYGRSLNRPEFREITPYNDFDFTNNERIVNNITKVTPSTIDNLDLRAEWYPRPAEMISVGVFYKHLKNPIEKIRNEPTSGEAEGSGLTEISYINSDKAIVYGVEAEIRKNLGFLPGNLFRNISVILNGAYIKSEAKKHTFSNDYEKQNIGPNSGRPLQGQAPYVVNAGLFYENAGWGTKISGTYSITGPSIYAISIRNPDSNQGGIYGDALFRPSLLELPRHLIDFSLSQRIIKTLTLRLNLQNALDEAYRIVEDHNNDQRYNKEQPVVRAGSTYYTGDNIFRKFRPGRYITFNMNYTF